MEWDREKCLTLLDEYEKYPEIGIKYLIYYGNMTFVILLRKKLKHFVSLNEE